MRKIYRYFENRIMPLFLCLLMTVSLCACGKKTVQVGDTYKVYFLAEDGSSIVPVDYLTQLTDKNELVEFLINAMEDTAQAPNSPVLSGNSAINSYSVDEGQVTIDFSGAVNDLPNYTRVLIRAAVTRTLTQVNGVGALNFTVNNEAMTDSTGAAVGLVKAEDYIENAGAQINPDEHTLLTLYFADESGNKLVKVKRNVIYSSNISLDKLVVEQLLEGPAENENAYPVMNTDTQIINVTTQDGTCYVNLSSDFLNSLSTVSTDVAIYSIVDSLIELGTINKVQFTIDGDSDVTFRETVNLTTQFVRNLDIVE